MLFRCVLVLCVVHCCACLPLFDIARCTVYGDYQQAVMWCRRKQTKGGVLFVVDEQDCQIHCQRTNQNYTLLRSDGWQCGDQKRCLRGICVKSETAFRQRNVCPKNLTPYLLALVVILSVCSLFVYFVYWCQLTLTC
jgi:hypothetical protein